MLNQKNNEIKKGVAHGCVTVAFAEMLGPDLREETSLLRCVPRRLRLRRLRLRRRDPLLELLQPEPTAAHAVRHLPRRRLQRVELGERLGALLLQGLVGQRLIVRSRGCARGVQMKYTMTIERSRAVSSLAVN